MVKHMEKPVFARMSFEDLDEVLEIEKSSFPTPWTLDMFLFEMCQISVSNYYVARDSKTEKVIGYVCFWLFEEEVQITNIAVNPLFRKHGIGRQLLQFAVEKAKEKKINEIFLEVRVTNEAAKHLYDSEGFIEIGRRKKYYSDTGEDAQIMKKTLIY